MKRLLTTLLLAGALALPAVAALKSGELAPDYCAGEFPVASDPDGKIAKSFDLKVMAVKGAMKDTRGVEIEHGDRLTQAGEGAHDVHAHLHCARAVENGGHHARAVLGEGQRSLAPAAPT